MDSKQDSDSSDSILSERKPAVCHCCFQILGNPGFQFFSKSFLSRCIHWFHRSLSIRLKNLGGCFDSAGQFTSTSCFIRRVSAWKSAEIVW